MMMMTPEEGERSLFFHVHFFLSLFFFISAKSFFFEMLYMDV